MVYYGALSKGCQRCRQRKIKCDQRKPGCMRCENQGSTCPGYRNLGDIQFRDESHRIIRNANRGEGSRLVLKQHTLSIISGTAPISQHAFGPYQPMFGRFSHSIPPRITEGIDKLAAGFFFATYVVNEGPVTSDYNDWLTQTYLDHNPDHALRAVVEAVGLAGLANVKSASDLALTAKVRYGRALQSLSLAMRSPSEAASDSTLMAVVFSVLFEAITHESWEDYRNWKAHVQAATVILALRGREQFSRERGAHLFLQCRSLILSFCMQQSLSVPPALVQAGFEFENSAIRHQWNRRCTASRGSIFELSLRIVNLNAALRSGKTKAHLVHATGLDINEDLDTWKATAPTSWNFTVVDVTSNAGQGFYDGKSHVYREVWMADAWNTWRILKILIHRILLQNDSFPTDPSEPLKAMSVAVIRDLSAEICVSAPSFTGSPRFMSLIEPLFVVALEELNCDGVRSFAIEQLRRISDSMGIRQAKVFADTASKALALHNKLEVLDASERFLSL